MKVSVWYNNSDIRLQEIETPQPGEGEILVKVASCGICGSDVVEWYRLPRAPLVQGHELSGLIVETGKNVCNFTPGKRVFVVPKVPCMECIYCKSGHHSVCTVVKERLPGGFAEYVLVPSPVVQKGTFILPDSMSFDQGTFIEPLACVVRAQEFAGKKSEINALIFGCGVSGTLHIRLGKLYGWKIAAVDPNPFRLEFAKNSGAEFYTSNLDNLSHRITDFFGRKADVIILCTSSLSAIRNAWDLLDKGGVLIFFAVPEPNKEVPFPVNNLWTKEIKILTSYYCGPQDIQRAFELISTKKVEVEDLITHRLPLEKTAEGFKLVLRGENCMKVIIKPNPSLV